MDSNVEYSLSSKNDVESHNSFTAKEYNCLVLAHIIKPMESVTSHLQDEDQPFTVKASNKE